MFIKEMIEHELKKIEWLIGHAEKELEKYAGLPEKTLVCEKKGAFNIYYFAQYRSDGRQVREYLGKPDNETVKKYKIQRFLRESLKVLYKDKRTLEKADCDLADYSTEAVHAQLPSTYKNLPDDCYNDGRFEVVKEWAAKKYDRNTYPLPANPNIARDGTKLRSKGECMIYDNTLFEGMPVRTDSKIRMRGKSGAYHTFCPDFLFLCKDNSFMILEHFGKLEDNDYAKDNIEKIQNYLDCGFVLGDNLMITSDNIDHNTNELMILETLDKIKKRMNM